MLTAEAAAPITLEPFPGLRCFTENESHLFFGRDGQSDELVTKLEQHRFVAITGNSGSGKSSLAKAGLIPSLCAGYLASAGTKWHFCDFRPRNAPVDNLSQALAQAGLTEGTDPNALRINPQALVEAVTRNFGVTQVPNFLILVDQFEELFRFKARPESPTADRDEKDTFVNLLLEAANQRDAPIYVAITLRSDFLGECARFRNLPENINDSQYLVPRLTREQRRMAIEGPVQVAGAEIAPRLVQRLLNETGEDPDQLPVLQHVLMRIWNQWKKQHPNRAIDFQDYKAIGGLEAISEHAGEAYEEARTSIGERGQIVLKRLFQRLSDKDQHGRETRRPTSVGELREVCEAPFEQIRQALDCFRKEGRSFLTPFRGDLRDDIEIDITHECLLRKWHSLKAWNREEEDSRRVYLRIATRAEESLVAGQDTSGPNGKYPLFSEYLSGVLLERSTEWWQQRRPTSIWAARYHPAAATLAEAVARFDLAKTYLEESKRLAEKARRSAKWRRLLNLLAPLAAAVTILIFVGYMKSLRDSKLANARALTSDAALASYQYDAPHAQALLAAHSLLTTPTIEAQMVLNSAMDVLPVPLQPLKERPAFSAEFSADGKWFAVAGEGGVDIYSAQDGKKQRSWAIPGTVRQVMFGGSSVLMAAVGQKILLNGMPDAWAQPLELTCTGPITNLAANRTGLTIVALCGAFNIWQAPNSVPATEQAHDAAQIKAVAVSPNGSRIAYAHGNSDVWGIDIITVDATAKGPHVISTKPVYEQKEHNGFQSVHQSPPADIQFDPDSSDVLISADEDGTVRSWRIRDSTPSPSPAMASGKGVKAWKTAHGKGQELLEPRMLESAPLFKMPAAATHLKFSEDGTWMLVSDETGAAKLWDRSHQTGIAYVMLGMPFESVSVSRAAAHIAAVGKDNSVHLWKLSGDLGQVSDAFFRGGGSYLIAHTLQNSSLVSSKIIDLRTGKAQSFPLANDPKSYPLTLSMGADLIAEWSGFTSRGITIKRFLNGQVDRTIWEGDLEGDHLYQTSFLFSRHGRYLLGPIERANQIRLVIWDLKKNGPATREFPARTGDTFDFAPDEQSLFVANVKSGLRRLDIQTGKEIPVSWPGHEHFSQIAISPDGTLVETVVSGLCDSENNGAARPSSGATSATESVVRILDFADGRVQSEVRVAGCLQNVGVSRNSRHFLTLNSSNTVQLWNLRSGAEEARLTRATSVDDFDFTPDGRIAIVDKTHYTLSNWQTRELTNDLCGRVNGDLSQADWNRFAPGQAATEICSQSSKPLQRW